ncbi:putative HAT dimerization domain, ribonuclease H-like superfamily [Helianthus annuus]|nr:putative HAT dimerization domain, ribonuclease H-like superfamily [Helianthus annuus]
MPQKEKQSEGSHSTSMPMGGSNSSEIMDVDEFMTKRFEMAMGDSETSLNKNELDKYLSEDREPMDARFDILKWWKVQQCRYPILAKMARDILAIPVSTVVSE